MLSEHGDYPNVLLKNPCRFHRRAKLHNLSQTTKTIAQKSVRVESVRQKKPPRCIAAGGGSVLIAQGAGTVCHWVAEPGPIRRME
jgi:hypothetical protein